VANHTNIKISEAVTLASKMGIKVTAVTAARILEYVCEHEKKKRFQFTTQKDGKVKIVEIVDIG